MDFQRFGIDPRLAKTAEGLRANFYFYEKMLVHAIEKEENVCAKIALDEGREEVLLLPALQWLLSGQDRKVLIAVPDRPSADKCAEALRRLGSEAGIEACLVDGEGPAVEVSPELAEAAPAFEGDPSAAVLIGTPAKLLAASSAEAIRLKDYGFLVADGADSLADLPVDLLHRFTGALLPSWERRSVLACDKITAKARNLAWDLADNPSEISIEGEVEKGRSVVKRTYRVGAESKIKILLGILASEKSSRTCIFCNLKDTADEVARRLAGNGIGADRVLASYDAERKFALLEKFRAGEGSCLVLIDSEAEGLSPGVFPLIVNYDIPLEPELFVQRLTMLDRGDPGAKVLSLACDRYMVGLPVIEGYIDEKLELLPIDESLLSVEDRSPVSQGRRSQPGAQREGGQQRQQRRGPPGSGRSDKGGWQPQQQGGRPGDKRSHGPRRDDFALGPDIRKSIAEATGGSLDMALDQGQPGLGRPEQGERRGPQRQGQKGRRNDPRQGGGRPDQRNSQKGRGQQRPHGPRPQSGEGVPPQLSSRAGNPYDLPMEERMKLYREKYGRKLEAEPRENPEGGRNHPKGKSPSRGGQHGRQQGRQGRPQGSPQGGPQGPRRDQGKERPQSVQTPPVAPPAPPSGAPSSLDEAKQSGILGRLFGPRKKKEE
jgi:Superfamily II DNA and RNA helicases